MLQRAKTLGYSLLECPSQKNSTLVFTVDGTLFNRLAEGMVQRVWTCWSTPLTAWVKVLTSWVEIGTKASVSEGEYKPVLGLVFFLQH